MLLREPIPPLLPTFRQFDRYSAIVGSSLLSSSFPQRPMKKNVTIQTGCFPKISPFPIFPFPLKRSGIDQDSNVLFPYVRNSSKPSNYSDRSIRRRKRRKKYRNRSSSSPPKKFLLVTGRRRRNANEGISFRAKKRRYYSRGGDVSPSMGLIHGLSWSAYARKGSEEGPGQNRRFRFRFFRTTSRDHYSRRYNSRAWNESRWNRKKNSIVAEGDG